MKQTAETVLNRSLEPLCTRDDHVMHYEPSDGSGKQDQTLASYRCNFEGCSVRYDPQNGYFTVINTPDQPYFLEEPGVNLLRCPVQGTWLYKAASNDDAAQYTWRCGVDGCDYDHSRQSAGSPVDKGLRLR